jgi:NTF2 fold immunity protein of polymorphic toxin system component
MKKRILLIVMSMSIVLGVFLSINAKAPEKKQRDYVPDKETALKIGEALLFPVYGDRIDRHRPLNVELRSDSIWYIYGSRPTSDYRGGVPNILISKRDCRVIGRIYKK